MEGDMGRTPKARYGVPVFTFTALLPQRPGYTCLAVGL